jgi:hypothetical protein
MDRYVGVDAHARSCTLAVMAASNKRVKSMVEEASRRALLEAVRSIGGRLHMCLEEGTQSAWLYELLAPQVTEIAVTIPGETRGAKDDERDAWARAEELRGGRDSAPRLQGSSAPSGTAERGAGVPVCGHGPKRPHQEHGTPLCGR